MKLLDKKTVSTQVALQKKQQIDEGVSIAKKIDALRETLSSLEAQHQKFIGGMKLELEIQTQFLSGQKDSLVREISLLKEERKLLQEPIDLQVKELAERDSLLREREEKLRNDRTVLSQMIIENEKESHDVYVEKRRVDELHRIASENLVESENTVHAAREKAQVLKKEAYEMRALTEEIDQECVVRENTLFAQERTLLLKEDTLQKLEKKLLDQEKTLQQQFKSLERAQKHGK